MLFEETKLKGVFIIDLDYKEDERGFFARSFCRNEFEKYRLNAEIAQCSISFNKTKGTLRGMHYQTDPYQESKLVRCIRGAMYDVVLDLRPNSSTFKQWMAVELSTENRKAVYIPGGCAHGFQTLEDNVEILYQISEFYHPECSRGVRWDDCKFGISWPLSAPIMSEKDRNYLDFEA